MTSTEPSRPAAPTQQPSTPADVALADAIAVEHATIYGYGFVSAHSYPDVNYLVADAMAQHRARREAAIEKLTERSVLAPVPAVGYQLPKSVQKNSDAVGLAVQMESDAATAWRVVLERAESDDDRKFAVESLTECAIRAAQWRKVIKGWPLTVAFPGGTE